MRSTLFALAFLTGASVLAATLPSTPALADAPAVDEAAAAEASAEATRLAARVVIRSKKAVRASIELQNRYGEVVRTYRDEMLWNGRNVLTLDLGGIGFGSYKLVVTTPYGTHTSPIVI
jgi:hypothetical protein